MNVKNVEFSKYSIGYKTFRRIPGKNFLKLLNDQYNSLSDAEFVCVQCYFHNDNNDREKRERRETFSNGPDI